jgi:diadenosine tetraphosphate (Ap4A) HIT family hydrolase
MSETSGQWMSRERWDALVRGENCPLCAAIKSSERVDAYGYTIADLGLSRLRLGADQFIPGYCVLICRKHVREPYHLPAEERAIYFDDMMRAAQALDRVFAPIKMNVELLGNAVPHLHCHIKPRFYGDPAPGRPLLHSDEHAVVLTPEAYERRVRLIRAALNEV